MEVRKGEITERISGQEQKARRQGYIVRKSRAALSIDNQGQYALVDCDINAVVLGSRFDAELEEIAEFLDPQQ